MVSQVPNLRSTSRPMDASGRLWLVLGLCLALGLLLAIASYGYRQSRVAAEARAMEAHTLLVLKRTLESENAALLMEANQRAFLISGQARFLTLRDRRHVEAVSLIDDLIGLVKDNPAQMQRVGVSRDLLGRRYATMQIISGLAGSADLATARANFLGSGIDSIDPIKTLLREMRDAEERLLIARRQILDRGTRRLNALLVYGTGMAFLILIGSGVVLLYQLARTERVSARLASANEEFDRRGQELQSLNRFLDLIFENIPHMIFVKDAKELRFVRFNRAGEALLGMPRDAMLGKSDYDFFPGGQAEFFQAKDRETLRTGAILAIDEEPIQTAGGERWLHTKKIPVLDDDGEPEFLLGISEDITERKTVAESLRASEERARTIIDTAYDAFVAIDASGNIITWNAQAEATFGWSQAEVVGRKLSEIIIPEQHRQAHERGLQNFHATGQGPVFNKRIELTALHRDGREFPIELTIWPLGVGDSSTFNAFLRDISERKQAEQSISELNRDLVRRSAALEAANRELESFSYSVSHDLRAPLRHIDGYARMLTEDIAPLLTPESRRYLQAIIDSARRMGLLIDDLLNLARLGRKPLNRQEVDMQGLVASAIAELVAGDTHGAAATAQIDVAKLPMATGDSALLKQVWLNLLSNATKYSSPRGNGARVEIRGERDGGVVRFTISDNGVGFDMRYADKLFGVFQRLHAQDQFEGTGVGLAIVHRVVSRHGGRVSASAEPDRGAVFCFELPIGEATP